MAVEDLSYRGKQNWWIADSDFDVIGDDLNRAGIGDIEAEPSKVMLLSACERFSY